MNPFSFRHALLVALVAVAPAAFASTDHSAHAEDDDGSREHERGHAELIPDCVEATLRVQTSIDPPYQHFEARFDETCRPRATVEGIAELWVADELVASAPLDEHGRADLHHIRGPELATMACVAFHGTEHRECKHDNDSPGHARHDVSGPLDMSRCEIVDAW